MRRSKQATAETRERIVATAAAEFRRGGLSLGLAEVMAAAELTHGGFYRHFGSKDQLVAEAFAAALEGMTDRLAARAAEVPGRAGVQEIVARYLSAGHRDDAAGGCPLTALGSELARADGDVRAAATAGLRRMVGIIAGLLAEGGGEAAEQRALAIVATMIGALTMARVVTDGALSAAILDAAVAGIGGGLD